jgi:hypothetical protein
VGFFDYDEAGLGCFQTVVTALTSLLCIAIGTSLIMWVLL